MFAEQSPRPSTVLGALRMSSYSTWPLPWAAGTHPVHSAEMETRFRARGGCSATRLNSEEGVSSWGLVASSARMRTGWAAAGAGTRAAAGRTRARAVVRVCEGPEASSPLVPTAGTTVRGGPPRRGTGASWDGGGAPRCVLGDGRFELFVTRRGLMTTYRGDTEVQP